VDINQLTNLAGLISNLFNLSINVPKSSLNFAQLSNCFLDMVAENTVIYAPSTIMQLGITTIVEISNVLDLGGKIIGTNPHFQLPLDIYKSFSNTTSTTTLQYISVPYNIYDNSTLWSNAASLNFSKQGYLANVSSLYINFSINTNSSVACGYWDAYLLKWSVQNCTKYIVTNTSILCNCIRVPATAFALIDEVIVHIPPNSLPNSNTLLIVGVTFGGTLFGICLFGLLIVTILLMKKNNKPNKAVEESSTSITPRPDVELNAILTNTRHEICKSKSQGLPQAAIAPVLEPKNEEYNATLQTAYRSFAVGKILSDLGMHQDSSPSEPTPIRASQNVEHSWAESDSL